MGGKTSKQPALGGRFAPPPSSREIADVNAFISYAIEAYEALSKHVVYGDENNTVDRYVRALEGIINLAKKGGFLRYVEHARVIQQVIQKMLSKVFHVSSELPLSAIRKQIEDFVRAKTLSKSPLLFVYEVSRNFLFAISEALRIKSRTARLGGRYMPNPNPAPSDDSDNDSVEDEFDVPPPPPAPPALVRGRRYHDNDDE